MHRLYAVLKYWCGHAFAVIEAGTWQVGVARVDSLVNVTRDIPRLFSAQWTDISLAAVSATDLLTNKLTLNLVQDKLTVSSASLAMQGLPEIRSQACRLQGHRATKSS